MFLQGSYGNDTNVYAESDVDVVIRLDDTFYTDLSDLRDDERALYDAGRTVATYGYDTFKADVVKALKKAFGDGFVHEGPKAIWIKPSGNRRSADVIVSASTDDTTGSGVGRINGTIPGFASGAATHRS